MHRAPKVSRRGWLLVAAGACVPLLAACRRDSAEDRLRRRIADMRDGFVDRKLAAVMAGVDADFIGSGGLDQDGIRQLLRLQFLRKRKLGVTLGPLGVQLRGTEAEVTFKAMLTGGDGSVLPDEIQGWTVRSGWRDGADGWRVVEADWNPVF